MSRLDDINAELNALVWSRPCATDGCKKEITFNLGNDVPAYCSDCVVDIENAADAIK